MVNKDEWCHPVCTEARWDTCSHVSKILGLVWTHTLLPRYHGNHFSRLAPPFVQDCPFNLVYFHFCAPPPRHDHEPPLKQYGKTNRHLHIFRAEISATVCLFTPASFPRRQSEARRVQGRRISAPCWKTNCFSPPREREDVSTCLKYSICHQSSAWRRSVLLKARENNLSILSYWREKKKKHLTRVFVYIYFFCKFQ